MEKPIAPRSCQSKSGTGQMNRGSTYQVLHLICSSMVPSPLCAWKLRLDGFHEVSRFKLSKQIVSPAQNENSTVFSLFSLFFPWCICGGDSAINSVKVACES